MNDLRLLLFLIGICILAGIYFWDTFRSRKQQRQQTIKQGPAHTDLANLRIRSRPDQDIDYASELVGLNQSLTESRQHEQGVTRNSESLNQVFAAEQDHHDAVFDKDASSELSPDTEPEPEPGQEQVSAGAANGVSASGIITLHVIPRADQLLGGRDIMEAVEELDFRFGAMDIFHHHGVGEMKSDKALFSMANMLEPGSFDLQEMDTFTTRGLLVFMCLPTPVDPQVVFELMLNTTQRLADLLGAEVCDENRNLLGESMISSIRRRIET